ncbi:hypothetical protein JXD20_02920 [Candidatus Peregrinibacteria bacterium]|nr:hypothetical protein [Candidatus Peregrinibacteria bacterium]
MSFKILADTFSVARDSSHFVQLKTLKSPRTEDQLWVAFKIEGDTKYARSTMQDIIDTLDEVFFDHLDVEVYERFEHALKEVNLTYKTLKEKRGIRSVGNISAIIAVFSGNELHLTQTADAEAYLVRKGKLSLISEGLSGKSDDLFTNIASGELLPEDKIIFSTSRLLRMATHSQLAQMCSEGVTEALDAIRELVLSDNELSIGVTCLSTKLPHRGGTAVSKGDGGGKALAVLGDYLTKTAHFIQSKFKLGGRKLPMEKNNILIAIGIIAIVLILSISFLLNSRHDSQLRDEYRLRIEAMNQDLHVANTKGYANDKETANAILNKVETDAKAILDSKYFRAEALALLDKVQATRDSINNTKRITDITPYVNLSTKRENVEATGFVNLDDNFFVYEYNALYEVILDQVLDPKTIDQTEVVVNATAMEDQGLITMMTQSGRIIEYFDGQFEFVGTDDETWKSGVDMAAYGRNLYILNPTDNQIYKYSRARAKYGNATEYSLDANLSGALSLAIDGNIYVLKEDGSILKIFKGEQQSFEIDDLATDISSATEILTLPEHRNLYVLDLENRRVIILEKEVGTGARYTGQVYFEELDDVQDFYVDKKEDKLYLLTKKAIYQVEI